MKQPANNVFSQASAAISKAFNETAGGQGADFSQFRVKSVAPDFSHVMHAGPPNGPSSPPAGGVFPLGGTNYLGAAYWPELREIGKRVIDELGVGSFGTCPLSGETIYHEQLKRELARLYRPHGDGKAFLTATASMANITSIPMFVGHGDTIFFEEENHMTLVEGATLSRAQMVRYKHNDPKDLEAKLKEADQADPKRARRRLIISDGIFSMSGHVANLPELSRLSKEYGCMLMIDESHALGTVGKTGHGTHEYWGMDPSCMDIVSGTLGKAVGCMGGYVIASDKIATMASLEYMTNRAFSSVFPGVLAACGAEVVRQMNEATTADNTYKKMFERERKNVSILSSYLLQLRPFGFDTEPEQCPAFVQRLVIGKPDLTFQIQKALYDRGVYVLGYVYPIVHQGKDMLRITCTASISEEDMHHIGKLIVEVSKAAVGKA